MKLAKLFDDERAVSPVIGVILMVAITVILAAVIGTFVLGLGDQVQQTTPRVSFGFDTSNSQENVTITHESGDTVDSAALSISAGTDFAAADSTSDPDNSSMTWTQAGGTSGDVSAGSSVEISASANGTSGDFVGDTIRVLYDSPDSENTATLAKYEVS